MKLISWNLNGIRACHRSGNLDVILKKKVDVFAFQELKAKPHQIPQDIIQKFGEGVVANSAERPGYSGVGFIFKGKKYPFTKGVGDSEFDSEGRVLITELPQFHFINAYFPNGRPDHSRVDYKLNFSELILRKALALKAETGKEVVIGGDINTAHQEIDLARPKANQKTTGFLPRERQWIDRLLEHGFIDIFRYLYPETVRYSWWSYRANARERNVGWRIDSFYCTKCFVDKVKDLKYLTEIKGSDHCPLELTLKN